MKEQLALVTEQCLHTFHERALDLFSLSFCCHKICTSLTIDMNQTLPPQSSMVCVTMKQLREYSGGNRDHIEAIDSANGLSLSRYSSFFNLTLSGMFAKLLH